MSCTIKSFEEASFICISLEIRRKKFSNVCFSLQFFSFFIQFISHSKFSLSKFVCSIPFKYKSSEYKVNDPPGRQHIWILLCIAFRCIGTIYGRTDSIIKTT